MNTYKAIYWIALAAFALALHGEYQKGSYPAVQRAAGRAEFMLCRAATHAERTFALARVLITRQPLPPDNSFDTANATYMAENQVESLREQARDEAELIRDQVRAQADLIRAQAQVERAQIRQMRLRTRSQFRMSRTAVRRLVVDGSNGCPNSRVPIHSAADPESSDEE